MEDEALAALKRLGLTAYEAQVYVALEKLQAATASEIADVSDVPRSQVYQTAAALEDRGFVEEQQANPRRYRVVPVSEIRKQFEEQFRRDTRRAFEYINSIHGSLAETERESPAEIWTVQGQEKVAKRTRQLLDEARETAIYGARPAILVSEEEVVAHLSRLTQTGVETTMLIDESATVDLADDIPTVVVPDEKTIESQTGRILAVDGTALLLSVVSAEGDETAIWSAGTDFAHVLDHLVDGWVDNLDSD